MIKKLIKPTIYFVALFFIVLPAWVHRYFGEVSFDQLLFTIQIGIKANTNADPWFIKRFVRYCIVKPLIVTFLLLFIEKMIYCFKNTKKPFRFIYQLHFIFKLKPHFLLLLGGILYTGYYFNFIHYVKKELWFKQSDYFSKHYINPKHIAFNTHKQKSLVVIYIESLENTYSDKNLFGKDLLHSLNTLKVNGITFNHYVPMPGTEWTIAGLVATQCGIPLKSLSIYGKNRQGEMLTHFLSNATCLGDILAANGYTNVFMNGSSLNYAGKGQFFKDHHYTERYGKEEWLAKGYHESDINGWGLYDDLLFKEAKLKLADLIKRGKLFNLTILTVDTHGANGFLDKSCEKQGYRQFDGIVECTANEASDFVNFIIRNGWLDKVNIVVLGDHLAMKNPVSDKLESSPSRTIFNVILTNQRVYKNKDDIVGFDLLPTLLSLSGVEYDKPGVALGYSALSTAPLPFKSSSTRLAEMENNVDTFSKTYNELWEIKHS